MTVSFASIAAKLYGLQYYTNYDAKAMNFAMRSYYVSKVTYTGIDYYSAVQSSKQEMYGAEFIVEMTRVVRFHNGWIYEFQFGGTKENKYFSDFESLLKSVQYPTISNIGGVGSTNNTTSNNLVNDSDDSSGIIAVVLLIVVAVIVVAVVISRKKNNHTPIYNTLTPEPPSNPEPTIYCTKCSQALPLDSNFCHKCGTKVFKEDNAE